MKPAYRMAALIVALTISVASTAVRADVVTDQSRISVSAPQVPDLEGRQSAILRQAPMT